jgi:hypothetical protein
MKNTKYLMATMLIYSSYSMANPEMVEAGKELHNEFCIACHGSEMYTRQESKIKNHFDLRRQVSFCKSHLSLDWFPEEETSVIKYLNSEYYNIEEDKK